MWPYCGYGMMSGQGFGSGSFVIFGTIINIFFFLLIFAGIVILIYWFIRQNTSSATSTTLIASNAMEILKTRYAKGEITKEELEEMKKNVGS